jgi:hypothetical protein
VKLIEVPTTPLDKMFTGGPVSYTPGSAKRASSPVAREQKPDDAPPAPSPKPVEPSTPPSEQGDQTT